MAELDDYKPRRRGAGSRRRGGSGSASSSAGRRSCSSCSAARSPSAPASRRTSCSRRNLFFICLNVGEVAIMALPLTLIVITGEIDLSVASMLGLCRRADGRALQARLADLAGDDRGRRPRRGPRRVQRLPRHARRPAVARGHDRNADALPRHRPGDPADRHDRRLPDDLTNIGVVPIPRHAHPVLDRVLRRAGGRLRASSSTRRRSGARSSRSAPARRRRSSPASASSGSSSGCSSSRGC